jgi:hypothetical protein
VTYTNHKTNNNFCFWVLALINNILYFVNFCFKFPKSLTPFEHTIVYSKHGIHCHSLKKQQSTFFKLIFTQPVKILPAFYEMVSLLDHLTLSESSSHSNNVLCLTSILTFYFHLNTVLPNCLWSS